MGWFSILPASFAILELWIIRIFLFLALLTILPWAILIIYDLFLYVFRAIHHEIPFVGGRAQGEAPRVRRPSIKAAGERAKVRAGDVARRLSLSQSGSGGSGDDREKTD